MLAGFLVSTHAYLKSGIPAVFFARKPADLAIAIPDFHIATIDKLLRGAQCVRIAVGVDRLVRGNAIVTVDQVSPIGRHDVSPFPGITRGKAGPRAWHHAGTGGTKFRVGNRTETIEAYGNCCIWNTGARLVNDEIS